MSGHRDVAPGKCPECYGHAVESGSVYESEHVEQPQRYRAEQWICSSCDFVWWEVWRHCGWSPVPETRRVAARAPEHTRRPAEDVG